MTEVPIAPDQRSLREAALKHLARFSTTRQGLKHVLQRRVHRWSIRAVRAGMEEETAFDYEVRCRPWIDQVVASMEELGAVDDVEFARSRARSLTHSGRSRRAVKAHLCMKGIEMDMLDRVVNESLGNASDEDGCNAELVAALILARKRSVGPFQKPGRPEKEQHKILAIFARNGFSQNIAYQIFSMEKEEAEEYIFDYRSL